MHITQGEDKMQMCPICTHDERCIDTRILAQGFYQWRVVSVSVTLSDNFLFSLILEENYNDTTGSSAKSSSNKMS